MMWVLVFSAILGSSPVSVVVDYDNGFVCQEDATRIVLLGVTKEAHCEQKKARGA